MLGRGVNVCRSCDSRNLFLALDLGESPIANRLLVSGEQPGQAFPLQLRICSDCSLGQVGEFESRESIFLDYPYLSSTSQTWIESNKQFAREVSEAENLAPGELVIELASNDGYLLKAFQERGMAVQGIEPAKNVAEIANAEGVPTISEFFGLQLARKLRSQGLNPRILIAKNVVAHVPDVKDFVEGISELAGPETLVVVEAPTISQILVGLQFDTIYHEHFSYLSAKALDELFSRFGLNLVGAEKLTTHGGSVRFCFRKASSNLSISERQRARLNEIISVEESLKINQESSWKGARELVQNCLAGFRSWLDNNDPKVQTVAYGAAAKGVTLLAAAQAQLGSVNYVIDNSSEKANMLFPVVAATIMTESDFISQMNGRRFRYLILPWNLVDEIVPRIRKFDVNAEIVVAVPLLRSVG